LFYNLVSDWFNNPNPNQPNQIPARSPQLRFGVWGDQPPALAGHRDPDYLSAVISTWIENPRNQALLSRVAPLLTIGDMSLTVTDSGSGSDLINQILNSLALSDSGSGADGFANLAASLGLTDSGSGADALAAMILQAITDSGSGADSIGGLNASFSLSDSGSGTDGLSLNVALTLTDAGAGSDALLLNLLKAITDAGAGIDAVSHSVTSEGRIVKIKFTFKGPGAGISLKSPNVDINFKKPGTDFTLN
jgi:hypothetical protein